MRKYVLVMLVSVAMILPRVGLSCGGFFCQLAVPIDQAAEEIVFSQQGDQISALVRIEYVGDAENFSWVVPVPPSLELDGGVDLGSDTTIAQLDQLTRPQFMLDQTGQGCASDVATGGGDQANASAESDGGDDGGVTVEESTVGPFDVQLITSDNPDDMANWLVDNNYDLSPRGRELIEPYVLAGMKFVGLKLQSGQSTGSIQPIILRYQSARPMIPIRLTAVAAEDDMGVLVWIVGPSRAVPDNYKHVIPNYTRLNWFAGTQNAYASYQDLITDAMNEAEDGQGFATDMAAPLGSDILDSMTSGDGLQVQLDSLDRTTTDAGFIAGVAGLGQSSAFQAKLQEVLPLPNGQGAFIYFDTESLLRTYNAETLAAARGTLRDSFQSIEIDPIKASMALLPSGAYLTRLYTTLSADEMTVDPTFDYNTQMGDQSRERRALLTLGCGDNGTEWTLTLGAGTGRDGELVIEATGEPPFGPIPVEVDGQAASFRVERTTASALPDVIAQSDFAVVEVNGGIDGEISSSGSGGGGSGALYGPLLWVLGFVGWLVRRRV